MHHSTRGRTRGPYRADLQQVRPRRATRAQSCAALLPYHTCQRTYALLSWLRVLRCAGLALVVLSKRRCTVRLEASEEAAQAIKNVSYSCASLDPCPARQPLTEYENLAAAAWNLTSR